jgi:altronate dehydratase
MFHLPNETVKFTKSFNGLYYQKTKYNTNINKERTLVNHTIIPNTAQTQNLIHIMIAGVDDNVMIAGVARNTTNYNDINASKFVEISKDKPSKTLVESMENNSQAKNLKESDNNIVKIDLQNKIDKANCAEIKENNKIEEINEEKDNKEEKGKELSIKSCPMNATLADLLTKPLMKANLHKIRKMIKSIVGKQECVGAKQKYGTGTGMEW